MNTQQSTSPWMQGFKIVGESGTDKKVPKPNPELVAKRRKAEDLQVKIKTEREEIEAQFAEWGLA